MTKCESCGDLIDGLSGLCEYCEENCFHNFDESDDGYNFEDEDLPYD